MRLPPLGSRQLLSLGATVLILVGWFLFLRPESLGGPTGYVMVDGTSMAPTLHTGDLVLARKQSWYAVGDVIAYRIPKGEDGAGAQIIHRIVGGSAETGYITQGDNRATADLWHPKPGDVIGRMWFRVPQLASALAIFRAPLVLASLAFGFAFAATLFGRKRKPPAGPPESGRGTEPQPRESLEDDDEPAHVALTTPGRTSISPRASLLLYWAAGMMAALLLENRRKTHV